MLTKII